MILFPFVGASPQTIARGELVKVIRLTTRVRRPLRREFAPLRAALFEGTPMATGSEAIRLPQLPKYSGLETIVVGPGKLVIGQRSASCRSIGDRTHDAARVLRSRARAAGRARTFMIRPLGS